MNMRTGTAAVLVAALLLSCGCSQARAERTDAATDASSLQPPSKYRLPAHLRENYSKFSTVSAAERHVGRKLRIPEESLGATVSAIVVHDTEAGKPVDPRSAGIDLYLEDVIISYAPFDDSKSAQAFVGSIAADVLQRPYVKRVSVAGIDGVAWNPYYDEPKELPNGDWQGGLTITEAKVMWAEGDMVYAITSAERTWPELMRVAVSLRKASAQ